MGFKHVAFIKPDLKIYVLISPNCDHNHDEKLSYHERTNDTYNYN